ncbi:unnamed protein product [Polarella glacialis]|uniref:Uncharacterized protein n=1 Tax=Polarella glacialis TaxID=89957 RepID=A0A813HC10_POLGL|nr:unnamed protein product [Polarella glacialis]
MATVNNKTKTKTTTRPIEQRRRNNKHTDTHARNKKQQQPKQTNKQPNQLRQYSVKPILQIVKVAKLPQSRFWSKRIAQRFSSKATETSCRSQSHGAVYPTQNLRKPN